MAVLTRWVAVDAGDAQATDVELLVLPHSRMPPFPGLEEGHGVSERAVESAKCHLDLRFDLSEGGC